MKVFLTGGTGFVGRAVVKRLLQAYPNASVQALVRTSRSVDKLGEFPAANVEPVYGDLFDPEVLEQGMAGCDAVIHLVGIIREVGADTFERVHVEGSRNTVDAAVRAGVQRFLHMSAENTRPDAEDR